MLLRVELLFALTLCGSMVAIAFARRIATVPAHRVARGYLVAVSALMGIRVIAYVVANVFGARAIRPLSTGPFDPTNLAIGALYGLAAVHARRGGFHTLWRQPDLLLSLRLATGVAFVLAGLVNVFIMTTGRPDYFVQMGYTRTLHLFIMTAEVLGGVALLLPWQWLTLVAAAGLSVDMFGALYTQLRAGDPLDAAAFAMLIRLAPLVVLTANGRWITVAIGAIASVVSAVVGATVLYHP